MVFEYNDATIELLRPGWYWLAGRIYMNNQWIIPGQLELRPAGMYVEMNTHAHTTQSGIVISVEASPHITLPSGNTR